MGLAALMAAMVRYPGGSATLMPMPSEAGHSGVAVHVVIPTHTTRHLDCCLASIALQRRLPASVVVTCDTSAPEIGLLLDSLWPRVVQALRGRPAPALLHIFRPHQGKAMLNQVRNNGLRALEQAGRLRPADVVLVVDGDTLLAPDGVARHAELAVQGHEVVIPYRINLGESVTAGITPERILEAAAHGQLNLAVEGQTGDALTGRHRRYRRQLLFRRFLPVWAGVNKPHKPKILGGHHAVSVRSLQAVNGYDEQYESYGFDDDDLSRRLHALKPPPRTAIAVKDILAYHLWHQTRAPARPTDAPGYQRFVQELPVAAERGWRTPLPQPQPTVRLVSASPAAIAAQA
jgi:hypothetical protein